MGTRVREVKKSNSQGKKRRKIMIDNVSFDIEVFNNDLYETLKYTFDRLNLTWDDKYEMAKAYYEHYGNLSVNRKFKTNNGYEYDENGIFKLGVWISSQRQRFKFNKNDTPEQRKDKENRRAKLEQIGMVWNGFKAYSDKKWEVWYQEAEKYYKKYGDLIVPGDYEQNGKNLGGWIKKQRRLLKFKENDTPEQRKNKQNRRERLEKIGMVWNGNKALDAEKWVAKYQEAEKYYEKKGNLVFPNDCDQNEKKVKIWVYAQRRKLQFKENDTPEQRQDKENKRKRLELIGMVWDVKKNREEVKDVCIEYEIDVKKNSKIIKTIPLKEFKSKIEYLRVQGIPYVTNGVLHEIFNMSSRDIEKKYGVNLAFIITNFYVDDKRKGLD